MVLTEPPQLKASALKGNTTRTVAPGGPSITSDVVPATPGSPMTASRSPAPARRKFVTEMRLKAMTIDMYLFHRTRKARHPGALQQLEFQDPIGGNFGIDGRRHTTEEYQRKHTALQGQRLRADSDAVTRPPAGKINRKGLSIWDNNA